MSDWDKGKVSTLRKGQKLICEALSDEQLYAVILYNTQEHDENAYVEVSTKGPSVTVKVPGTTANQGLATVCLVSGSDGRSVSLAMRQDSVNPEVQAWLLSVSMPIDTTGLTNEEIAPDGREHEFGKYRRYYSVPAMGLHRLTLRTTGGKQFLAIQMQESSATIFVLNPIETFPLPVVPIGKTAQSSFTIVKAQDHPQELSVKFRGDGGQFVWMNIDNAQDSKDVKLSLGDISRL